MYQGKLIINSTPLGHYFELRGENMNMIEPISFNKYINKIGVEFEGLYKTNFYDKLSNVNLEDIILTCKGDGSVHERGEGYGYVPRECVTQPLNARELTTALEMFEEANDKKEYAINETCGLHYHISLVKNYYGYIDNKDFYKKFIKMFESKFPTVFNDRKDNSYCSSAISQRKHFTLCSEDRYRMINYCYQKHHTVEFRGYGGKYATISELGKIIQETIDFIGKYIESVDNKMKSVSPKEIEIELNENCRVVNLDDAIINAGYKKQENNYKIESNSRVIELNFDISKY